MLSDLTVPVVVVESEKAALAVTALGMRSGRRLLAIATGGCWGWRGKTGIAQGPKGEREEERGPLPDFHLLAWRGRKVLIAFDSNVASNPKVRRARQALAETLAGWEAKVYLVDLPMAEGINGTDDFIAVYGDDAMLSLLDTARPLAQTSTGRGPSQATRLLMLSTDVELFHTPEGRAYGTIGVGGHYETWPVCSTHFRQWLARRFYESEKGAPNAQALHDALAVISVSTGIKGNHFHRFGGSQLSPVLVPADTDA